MNFLYDFSAGILSEDQECFSVTSELYCMYVFKAGLFSKVNNTIQELRNYRNFWTLGIVSTQKYSQSQEFLNFKFLFLQIVGTVSLQEYSQCITQELMKLRYIFNTGIISEAQELLE